MHFTSNYSIVTLSCFLLYGCTNLQDAKLPKVSDFMSNAVDRIARVHDMTDEEKAKIIMTFEKLPADKITKVESLCAKAFENLTPSKCDRELLMLR